MLPLLKKHKSCTAGVISCLAAIFEAGRNNEIPRDTAVSIFDKVVLTTTSALSFQDSYPKNIQKEAYIHPSFTGYYRTFGRWLSETELVQQVVNFYSQCLFTHHDNEAASVLNWLKGEGDTADIRIFHEFILPFVAKLYEGMKQYDLRVSETQQEACQHMMLAFLNRCVGMEPAKPTTWTRSSRGCGKGTCLMCPRLNDFLKDPEKEIDYFEDEKPAWGKSHLHEQAYYPHGHECTPDHEMEDGKKMLRIKKSDKEWADSHYCWKQRCDKVASALKDGLIPSRPLLGERYEELVEMRPIKIRS